MRYLPMSLKLSAALASALLIGALFGGAAVAQNTTTSLLMHGVETGFGPCAIDDPCPDAGVTVAVGTTFAAYLVARNYQDIAGVQSAFDWPTAWPLVFGLWDCQSNQVVGTSPTVPGPSTGTVATAFDCIQGGGSAVIGRLHFVAAAPGCITQIESEFPFGTHVVSCTGEVTPITAECRGSVCAGSVGVDACAPCNQASPVESTTWGSIKSQYQ